MQYPISPQSIKVKKWIYPIKLCPNYCRLHSWLREILGLFIEFKYLLGLKLLPICCEFSLILVLWLHWIFLSTQGWPAWACAYQSRGSHLHTSSACLQMSRPREWHCARAEWSTLRQMTRKIFRYKRVNNPVIILNLLMWSNPFCFRMTILNNSGWKWVLIGIREQDERGLVETLRPTPWCDVSKVSPEISLASFFLLVQVFPN